MDPITTIKTIIEVIKMALSAYKFITGAITENRYISTIKKNKENYDKFMKGSRKDRLKVNRDENKE